MRDVVTSGIVAFLLEYRPESFQILNGRIHTSHILINESSGFDLGRWFVRDEIFSKSRKALQDLASTPQEAHVRREDFIAGTNEIITIHGLNVNESVRTIVDAIEKDLRSGVMGSFCGRRHIHDGPQRI